MFRILGHITRNLR